MINFTFITALLCTFNWISVSVCEFHTVEVQPGEEVTLMCYNFTTLRSYILWFKLDNRQNVSRISSMQSSDVNASFFDEFQNEKFDMRSNMTTIFLKIKQVDLFDSGLYFCGFYSVDRHSVIVSGTYLKVQEVSDGVAKQTPVMFDGVTALTIVILGALILFLIIIVICLVVKIRTLPKAHEERQNPHHSENLQSDALNYAALHFKPKVKISRGRSSEDQLDTNVVYSATR